MKNLFHDTARAATAETHAAQAAFRVREIAVPSAAPNLVYGRMRPRFPTGDLVPAGTGCTGGPVWGPAAMGAWEHQPS
jgi:hypothetical protein